MPAKKTEQLVVTPIQNKAIHFKVYGTSGLYVHSMAAKAKRDLLVGPGPKSRQAIKHHPYDEYRDCFHHRFPQRSPTYLGLPTTTFKQALASASIDTAGVAKAQTNRLVYVEGEWLPLWGVPELRIDVVRNSDINRTPDMRTRPFFREWATEMTVYYGTPMFTEKNLLTLVVNAGIITGVGDNRQEKGKANFGQFRIVSTDKESETWQRIVDGGGYKEQKRAYDNPIPYDEETSELLDYYVQRVEETKSAESVRIEKAVA